jgi:hypothetical protein
MSCFQSCQQIHSVLVIRNDEIAKSFAHLKLVEASCVHFVTNIQSYVGHIVGINSVLAILPRPSAVA